MAWQAALTNVGLCSAALWLSQADAGLKTALAEHEDGTTYEERTG